MKRKGRSIKDIEEINPNNRKASSKVNIHETTKYKAQKAIGFAIPSYNSHRGKQERALLGNALVFIYPPSKKNPDPKTLKRRVK